jgi:hypothetical protein
MCVCERERERERERESEIELERVGACVRVRGDGAALERTFTQQCVMKVGWKKQFSVGFRFPS